MKGVTLWKEWEDSLYKINKQKDEKNKKARKIIHMSQKDVIK